MFFPDAETKTVYRNRNNCYKRQRSLRDYPFKKRKLFDHGLEFNSDDGISSDALYSSPVKGTSVDVSGLGATAHGGLCPSTSYLFDCTSFPLKYSRFRV